MAFEEKPKAVERVSPDDIWGKRVLGRGNSQCTSLICGRKSREASMNRVEETRETVEEDRFRKMAGLRSCRDLVTIARIGFLL